MDTHYFLGLDHLVFSLKMRKDNQFTHVRGVLDYWYTCVVLVQWITGYYL